MDTCERRGSLGAREHACTDGEVLGDREARKDVVRLGDEVEAELGQLVGTAPGHVGAVVVHGARADAGQTVDCLEERGLARAVRADHSHDLGRSDLERDIVEHRHLLVAGLELLDS